MPYSPERSASSSHWSSFWTSAPRNIPRNRIAKLRIVANSTDVALKASTLAACGSVSSPRGFIQSAAATIGEMRLPVEGSLNMAVFAAGPSRPAGRPARRHWLSRRSRFDRLPVLDLPCKSGEPSPMKDSGGGDEQEQTKTIYERVQTGGGAADADQRTQRRAGC